MDHSYQPTSASHYAAAYDSYPSPSSSSSQPVSSQSSQRQHSLSSPSAYTSFLTLLIAIIKSTGLKSIEPAPALIVFSIRIHIVPHATHRQLRPQLANIITLRRGKPFGTVRRGNERDALRHCFVTVVCNGEQEVTVSSSSRDHYGVFVDDFSMMNNLAGGGGGLLLRYNAEVCSQLSHAIFLYYRFTL
eukprot:CAMPEP_0183787644 /NCGR_PEP_ID=MMETSP0739-20130205/67646_1 /TAXON_ID=385413 /ORGANISM="Thalassiosira miniscula, Strain CCMP1093" /LENGTH=188 /DNA_ID=CAMNT_0026031733 /DNA_START=749 /DNA_END=1315 /DNA_ORIENTATION=-